MSVLRQNDCQLPLKGKNTMTEQRSNGSHLDSSCLFNRSIPTTKYGNLTRYFTSIASFTPKLTTVTPYTVLETEAIS